MSEDKELSIEDMPTEAVAEAYDIILQYHEWKDLGLRQFFKLKKINEKEFQNFLENYEI